MGESVQDRHSEAHLRSDGKQHGYRQKAMEAISTHEESDEDTGMQRWLPAH